MKKYVSMNYKGLVSRFNNVSRSISSRNYKRFGLHLQLQKRLAQQCFGKWPLREIWKKLWILMEWLLLLLLGFDLLVSVGLIVWALYVSFHILTPELGFRLIKFEWFLYFRIYLTWVELLQIGPCLVVNVSNAKTLSESFYFIFYI